MAIQLNEAKMIAYILGELSDDEQLQLEAEIFSDDARFEQIQDLKAQLIDDYAGNRLSPQQRKSFEQQFLPSPWRRERVVIAHALTDQIAISTATLEKVPGKLETLATKPAPEKRSWRVNHPWLNSFAAFFYLPGAGFRTAIATTMLLLMIGSGILIADNHRLRSKLGRMEATQRTQPPPGEPVADQLAQARSIIEQLQSQVRSSQPIDPDASTPKKNEPDNSSLPIEVSFVLIPAGLRSEDSLQKLEIPHQTKQVELIVYFKTNDGDIENSTFLAQLITVEGKEILQAKLLSQRKGSNRKVELKLKASLLIESDYILRLSRVTAEGTTEEISEYPFRVTKK